MVIEYFLEWVQTAPVSKRAESALALVKAYQRSELSPEERDDVEAALTILLDDSANSVRMALACAFGAKQNVPRHMVSTLATDNTEISIVVLSRSPLFHDSELIAVARDGEIENQVAIACRPWISASVLDVICEHSCEEACIGVLANPVADFSDYNLHILADRFGDTPDIRNLLLERTDLPAETKLLIINKLSNQLSTFVSGNSWMSAKRAETIAQEANEKAAIGFAAKVSDEDVGRIARSLISSGKMNVSFLLRAVCMGNITLVARVISELSGVRFAKVEAILTKDRRAAFKAVYTRAGLPHSAFEIFSCAISTWRRLLMSGSKINQARMPFLVTREILEMYSGKSDEVVDELMILLRKLSAEAARESAKSKAVEISNRAPEVTKEISRLVSEAEAQQIDEAIENIEFGALVLEAENIVSGEAEANSDEIMLVELEHATTANEFDVSLLPEMITEISDAEYEEVELLEEHALEIAPFADEVEAKAA